jgi:hypothetical protein
MQKKRSPSGGYYQTTSYLYNSTKHTQKNITYTVKGINYYPKLLGTLLALFNIDTDFDIVKKCKLNSIRFLCNMVTLVKPM